MLRRLGPTIEIEVFRDRFVYRSGEREHVVATRGYIKKDKGGPPFYTFEKERKTDEYRPINLFEQLPSDLQADIVEVLGAFLLYGIRPLCTGSLRSLIRPIIVFSGVERFETGFGFEYAAFREAANLFALGDKEVYFK